MGRFRSEAKYTSRLWSASKEWWLGGLVVGGVGKKNKGVLRGEFIDILSTALSIVCTNISAFTWAIRPQS